MISKLLPVVLTLAGTGGGVAAGLWFGTGTLDATQVEATDGVPTSKDPALRDAGTGTEFVKLNNQFVIPIVERDKISAMVVMSLNVEIAQGAAQQVHAREPKLRDAFLQVLFDHANMGGFAGEFTGSNTMDVLRVALSEVAQQVLGDVVHGVLITGVARQDV